MSNTSTVVADGKLPRTLPLERRLNNQVSELNQAISDHMTQIQTIFKAIRKVVNDDPVLAHGLADVGVFIAEMADGDFDAISMQIECIGKEIH